MDSDCGDGVPGGSSHRFPDWMETFPSHRWKSQVAESFYRPCSKYPRWRKMSMSSSNICSEAAAEKGGAGGVTPPPSPVPYFPVETDFVNLLRSPGIDSQPGGPVRQPNWTYRPAKYIGWRNRFLVVDSWAFKTFTNSGSGP
jgi:hypothetical protein